MAANHTTFELGDKAYSKTNFEPATRVASAAPHVSANLTLGLLQVCPSDAGS